MARIEIHGRHIMDIIAFGDLERERIRTMCKVCPALRKNDTGFSCTGMTSAGKADVYRDKQDASKKELEKFRRLASCNPSF